MPENLALPEVMGEPAFTTAFNTEASLDHHTDGEFAHRLQAQNDTTRSGTQRSTDGAERSITADLTVEV